MPPGRNKFRNCIWFLFENFDCNNDQASLDHLPPACISRPAFRNHSAALRTLGRAVVSSNVFSLDN